MNKQITPLTDESIKTLSGGRGLCNMPPRRLRFLQKILGRVAAKFACGPCGGQGVPSGLAKLIDRVDGCLEEPGPLS